MDTITREQIKKNGFPKVPMLCDILQGEDPLETPEIRVWCHAPGGDNYETFPNFEEALSFINSPEGEKLRCENVPLIAFRGFEINLWDIPKLVKSKKEKA